MKFFTRTFQSIKSRIKAHTLMFIILILGITVSSGTLCLFYAQSAAASNSLNAYRGVNRILDFDISAAANPKSLTCVTEYVLHNSFDCAFYCAFGNMADEYSVIGADSNNPIFLNMFSGNWLSDAGQAVIPEGGFDGAKVGDVITVGEACFTVCGTYNPALYSGDMYSSKGFSSEKTTAAGMDMDTNNLQGVFIGFVDFANCGVEWQTLRIRFNSSLPAATREKISSQLTSYIMQTTGEAVTADAESLEAAKEVYSIDFFGKFVLYIIISLLSLVNILQILNLFIKRSKKQYEVLIVCGATKKGIYITVLTEILLYTVAAFTAGWFICKAVIQRSSLKYEIPYMGMGIYLVLLCIVCMIAAAFVLRTLNKTLKDPFESKDDDQERGSSSKRENLYLIKNNYTQGLWSEFIIFLQILFIAFIFTYAVSYYFEGTSAQRFADKAFGGRTVFCLAADPNVEMSGGAVPSSEQTLSAIQSLDGLEGYGTLHLMPLWHKTAQRAEVIGEQLPVCEIDSDILNRCEFTVKGKWLSDWSEGVDVTTAEYVPVVLTAPYAAQLNLRVGDVIEDMMFMDNMRIDDYTEYNDGTVSAEISADYYMDVKVVGIIRIGDRAPELSQFPLRLNNICYMVNDDCMMAYSPRLYIGQQLYATDNTGTFHYVLFPDNEDRLSEYKAALTDYGVVESLETMAEDYDEEFRMGSGMYIIQLCMATLLLAVGIAGYNLLSIERQKRAYGIYFACGMPWRKAIAISLTANGAIFLLGGIAGSFWGIYSAKSIRLIATDSTLYSILTALAYVLLLFIISSVSMLVRMLKTSPVSLIKKGD